MLSQLKALDEYRRTCDNLYHKVRCLLFLYAAHRFYLPERRRGLLRQKQQQPKKNGKGEKKEIICPKGYAALLDRRFEEAINHFLAYVTTDPDSISDFSNEDLSQNLLPKKTSLISDLTFDPTRKSATVRNRRARLDKRASRYESFSSQSFSVAQQNGHKSTEQLLLPPEATSSSLASAYRLLAFQTLADQVKSSVKHHEGNEWMFGVEDVKGQILRFDERLLNKNGSESVGLLERTPVRMDLSHSW